MTDADETQSTTRDSMPNAQAQKRGPENHEDTTPSEDEPPTKRKRLKPAIKNTNRQDTTTNGEDKSDAAPIGRSKRPRKSVTFDDYADNVDSDEELVSKRGRNRKTPTAAADGLTPECTAGDDEEVPPKQSEKVHDAKPDGDETSSEHEESEESEDEKPEVAAKAREKAQTTLIGKTPDPYPDWKPGDPVPYAALCTTFSKIEMTTKRLEIQAHCSLFLRQVLRLTPKDLLPTTLLMVNKLAADYTGVELGIGESLIMKAIGETTGRSLAIIKTDQNEIGDLGLVAAKSRSNQPTMFKPKPLTVRGVHEGLMKIATVEGQGAQGRKVDGIKKLLSAADPHLAGKGSKGIDITKEKGGPSEAKYIIRTLEGKMRLGLAEKTVLIALSQAMVMHEAMQEGGKPANGEQLTNGEAMLKSVYK